LGSGKLDPKSPFSRFALRFFALRFKMIQALGTLLGDDGQDVAEYAVMLAVVLAVVVGTIRLIGSSANNVFSSVGSAIQ